MKQTKVKDEGLAILLEESRQLRAEAERYLQDNGISYNLNEWITFKEYADRHAIESTNVISNWVSRGIVPQEDVRVFPYLNNLKLIRDKQYK